MGKRIWVRQAAVLLAVFGAFFAFNASLYLLLTQRLENNFSTTAQAKMVDVARYLPHEAASDLVRLENTPRLQGDLPVLDGAAALVPVYAAIIDNLYPPGCVTYEGGTFRDDNYYGENFAAQSKMQYRNTVRGYTAVVDGTCDILFCAAPSPAQRDYATQKGVELVYVPVGREGFVFFVNANNPIDSLTCAQVRDIYSGKYTSWHQLGGPRRIINPLTRLQGSGSQSAMEAFLGGVPIGGKSPLALFGGSIGFSFRYYFSDMVGAENVKLLALDGVAPTAENIRSGAYPAVTEFYAIYRRDNTNPNISLLVDWLLGPQGQQLVQESGYVALGP